MTEKTVIVCDVDDREGRLVAAASHVRLDVAGEVREFDLCESHVRELNDAVALILPDRAGAKKASAKRAARGRKATEPARSTAAARAPRAGGRGRSERPAGSGGGRAGASQRRPAASSLAFNEEVRRWAREQGLDVKDRGRISNTVIERYRTAQESAPPPAVVAPESAE